ncbi:MAG TPA: hypothetical protein VMG82_30595 [Candidatus Sulfotelmatobacter sp.]|nr:hypothetical protein [Candidatus Sulfotelmatobacter sp.]
MERLVLTAFLVLSLTLVAPSYGQKTDSAIDQTSTTVAPSDTSQNPPIAPAVRSDAPRMSNQTRLQIIRDFETQLVYSRTVFPMGTKGLKLKDGVITPSGMELQQVLALWGPSIKPGDPAHISYVHIKDNYIHFDLNGGAVHRKKWYQHIEVSGAGGASVPLSRDQATDNPHGSYLDIYFDKYVPEMSPAQLRALVYPVLDFNARNKEEAYLDTVPPKVKEAIKAHYVLVGMNTEMVIHARGKPPRKVREKDGDTDYEEWIYGEPPADVDFVRIIGDEVVRIETMKVGGQKIVRTEKEVILPKPEDQEARREEQDRPANAPSLRRPGEDPENAPKPSDGINPTPPSAPQDIPQPTHDPGGPGQMVGRR